MMPLTPDQEKWAVKQLAKRAKALPSQPDLELGDGQRVMDWLAKAFKWIVLICIINVAAAYFIVGTGKDKDGSMQRWLQKH